MRLLDGRPWKFLSNFDKENSIFIYSKVFDSPEDHYAPYSRGILCFLVGVRQTVRQAFWPTLKGYWTISAASYFENLTFRVMCIVIYFYNKTNETQ
jgi:hypothetical protein